MADNSHSAQPPAHDPGHDHGHGAEAKFDIIPENSLADRLLVLAAGFGLIILLLFGGVMLTAPGHEAQAGEAPTERH